MDAVRSPDERFTSLPEDPIMRGGDAVFQREVPGCAGQPHVTIEGGGHFLQEDRGEQLAQVVTSRIAGS